MSTTFISSTTATSSIKTEVLTILASLGISKKEAKDLRYEIASAAFMALNDGVVRIGPDAEWSHLWVIPSQHRSESWDGYISRLFDWAWKYIREHVIITDYMSDDEYMENPIYSLRPEVEFWTETEGQRYILPLSEVRAALSYAAAPVWSVRRSTTVQPDEGEVSTLYLTVNSPDEGECLVYAIGQVDGEDLYLPEGPIGNVSAQEDRIVEEGLTLKEALEAIKEITKRNEWLDNLVTLIKKYHGWF